MGCLSIKLGNYVDVREDEEKHLREFELEIGAFTKSLNEILPKLCVEKEIIKTNNVEEFILRDFNQAFLSFIQKGYFYKTLNGVQYYDAKKVMLLLFLLSKDSYVNNGSKTYHDKASFILHFIRSRNDQNLSEPITENEDTFISFIDDLVDIACDGIVDSYIKQKNIQSQGFILRLKEIKSALSESLITHIFKNDDNSRSNVLTFESLNQLFSNDKSFLTSGQIREVGWNVLKNGKGNEIDKKSADHDKKSEVEIKILNN
jgi:hypothetical protein